MIIDELIDAIAAKEGNPSVIGLDTCVDYLPEEERAKCTSLYESAKRITDFNFALIDRLAPVIPAVKVQVAYYEQYGVEGMAAFRDTLAYAKSKGIYTIADIKRNDIGSTAAAYARAYLKKGAPFEADFVTVNGYLGTDGVKPFTELCAENDKGIFVLVKTSRKRADRKIRLQLRGRRRGRDSPRSGGRGKKKSSLPLFPHSRLRRAGRKGGRSRRLLQRGRGRDSQLLARHSLRLP